MITTKNSARILEPYTAQTIKRMTNSTGILKPYTELDSTNASY
jgi:hypothetical protein